MTKTWECNDEYKTEAVEFRVLQKCSTPSGVNAEENDRSNMETNGNARNGNKGMGGT